MEHDQQMKPLHCFVVDWFNKPCIEIRCSSHSLSVFPAKCSYFDIWNCVSLTPLNVSRSILILVDVTQCSHQHNLSPLLYTSVMPLSTHQPMHPTVPRAVSTVQHSTMGSGIPTLPMKMLEQLASIGLAWFMYACKRKSAKLWQIWYVSIFWHFSASISYHTFAISLPLP